MPKPQTYVEVNHEGEWLHALVVGDPAGAGGQLRVSYWIGSDRKEITASKGDDVGEWREPQ